MAEFDFGNIIGNSKALRDVREMVRKVAPTQRRC
jgi:transcriptional regulator with GAF, ATPase, and Fis domain